MLWLLLLHFAAAVVSPLLCRAMGRNVFWGLAAVPGISFAWLIAQGSKVIDGRAVSETYEWVPSIGLSLDFRITSLQWILALLVTGVGTLVLIYCASYFKRDDKSLWRFSAVFTMFAGAMLGLVLSDNLLLMYVFWELTTVFSYLLVGHNPVRSANRRAAMQALLVTTFGGLAMLAGIVAIGQQSSYRISELLADPPPASMLTTAGVILMLVGALTKSAQIPFHFWLPGAMAAPTPVSAYLHAAAMVKAGIYLVALLAPIFADVPGWRWITIGLGGLTMLVGGWRALRQKDIKLLLAYGTVSQLGFLTAIAGIGTYAAGLAAVTLVVSHALFKSALFLSVGVIDRQTGTRDLTKLTGLARRMPVLCVGATLAAASMAGLPPLVGFVAKEASLTGVEESGVLGQGGQIALLAVIVVGSALTVAYSARFVWGAFASKPGVPEVELTRPRAAFVASPLILATASLVAGFAGSWLTTLITPYAATMPGETPPTLGLWHGFTLGLGLSAIAIATGFALFFARSRVARVQGRVPALVDGERTYNLFMRGLDRAAVEATALTQRGSLPIYVATIMIVVVAFPGAVALSEVAGVSVRLWDSPVQAAIGLLVIVAAFVAVRSLNRLQAVILVGATGLGTALLFLIHGAPDLALTQIVVETVSLVIFVLVLRQLPSRFRPQRLAVGRYVRLAVAVAVGVAVVAISLVTTSARVAEPVSTGIPDAAYDFGYGKNVVNVILVDVRAWDTFGEVAVLVVAATGIASLIFVRTRNTDLTRIERGPASDETSRAWLVGVRNLRPERRSVIFEVVTRLVFHAMIALSLYLLFVGHNLPGGGFAGGLVAGIALLVRYLAGGRYELDAAAPVDAGLVLGLGLFIAAATAIAPAFFGGDVFQSYVFEFWMPIWGDVKLVTTLFFDIGVYLIVVGLMLDIGRSLGSGIDRQIEEATEGAR
ncbi:Na+/H+ antiporter subunit A [Epidermidibacterium keratini]|uniref:Na+/H+ antiporter subunit A n=1 Tax=Epidermidibacterium keratini TaxID=1891644 RepID=A0A7L4YP46_9ACTN|nr:Na+/H+ antiporter subunit A [Epidermidibacterium keratini]QHC00802.1 Na+/H+ antiporter subunit A [Epidermidibacterium keratini]